MKISSAYSTFIWSLFWSLFSISQTQVLFIGQQRSYYLNNKRKINLIDMKKGEKSMGVICIIGFLFVWVIPLLKEEAENQSYREACRRAGDKTYWSTDGLRYTSNNQKVYK